MKPMIRKSVDCRLNVTSAAISLLVLTACATHEDPREGGLFGYNPNAYERRIAEREERLRNIRGDTAYQDMRRDELLEHEQKLKEQEAALETELRTLDREITRLEEEIEKDRATIGSSQGELERRNKLRTAAERRRELVEEIRRLENEALELEEILTR